MRSTTPFGLALAALLLAGTGCSSLRYSSDDELWAEGSQRFDSGQYSDSVDYYDEIIRRDEKDAKALLLRGVAHERAGDTQGALRDYAAAGRLGDPRGYLYRANLNIKTGATGEAEQDLTVLRDAGLSGRDQVVQLTLVGTLRLVQGQNQLAAQSLERAVDMGKTYSDPDTRRHVANAHNNAAQAYYKLGDFSRAYDHMIAYASASSGGNLSEQDLLDRPAEGLSGEDHFMLGLLAYLNNDFEATEVHFSRADPALVDQARKELDDPTLGTGAPSRRQGGVK
ncbi:MAG: tetratricopeptide repeat protein [Planctomycetota bacterium]